MQLKVLKIPKNPKNPKQFENILNGLLFTLQSMSDLTYTPMEIGMHLKYSVKDISGNIVVNTASLFFETIVRALLPLDIDETLFV